MNDLSKNPATSTNAICMIGDFFMPHCTLERMRHDLVFIHICVERVDVCTVRKVWITEENYRSWEPSLQLYCRIPSCMSCSLLGFFRMISSTTSNRENKIFYLHWLSSHTHTHCIKSVTGERFLENLTFIGFWLSNRIYGWTDRQFLFAIIVYLMLLRFGAKTSHIMLI